MSKIEYANIDKRFGKRKILRAARLSLRGGRCTLLSGPNGSGKSTLLRICAGLERPDRGDVDIGSGSQPWKRCRQTLHNAAVYLHQQPYMFDGTVVHNLAYALPRGMARSRRRQRIAEALQWAELEDVAENPAKALSGGERQRIAIARAWLRQPSVMLLDEPTANMDQEARRRTVQLLYNLKKRNIALLVASHDPEHFYAVADQWLGLEDGCICAQAGGAAPATNIVPLQQQSKQA